MSHASMIEQYPLLNFLEPEIELKLNDSLQQCYLAGLSAKSDETNDIIKAEVNEVIDTYANIIPEHVLNAYRKSKLEVTGTDINPVVTFKHGK